MELMITHADMRSLGYCNRGARIWFERHGLDFNLFRKEGLSADVLEATGDAMAMRLVNWVKDGRQQQ